MTYFALLFFFFTEMVASYRNGNLEFVSTESNHILSNTPYVQEMWYFLFGSNLNSKLYFEIFVSLNFSWYYFSMWPGEYS